MTLESSRPTFSSAEHLNDGIYFPKRSAASSCDLTKRSKKLSTRLFLVPTSGHLFTYSTSETAARLLCKSWFATAESLEAPGAEQICEAVDIKCLIFVYHLCS